MGNDYLKEKQQEMRKRLFEIIELARGQDKVSSVYDFGMMATIIISLIPLATKTELHVWTVIDIITAVIFILDYLFRLITADYKVKKGVMSFFIYPFTPMAIIDLISILPSVTLINSGFRVLKIFRLLRTFRVFRVFKAFRYSKNINIIMNVFRRQKESLTVVCILAVGYILVSALIVFNVEPDTFSTFFEAVYWATISLTTVGYGDVYLITTSGKIVTMISALFGIAIVALPAGIVTAGYMDEISSQKQREQKQDSDSETEE